MRPRLLPVLCGILALGSCLVAIGWIALAPIAPRSPTERELLYVIPKGVTTQKGSNGQFTLPSTIRLMLGVRDILVLRNDDEVPMELGPVRLAPGQTYRLRFHQPGALQLACSFHKGIGLVILVDLPPSPGWERLRWRLGWSEGYDPGTKPKDRPARGANETLPGGPCKEELSASWLSEASPRGMKAVARGADRVASGG